MATLAEQALRIVTCDNLEDKCQLAYQTARHWYKGSLGLGAAPARFPLRPGRPERPLLLAPNKMPKRSKSGEKGRIALLHSLAHIELNAVDLTWDLIARAIGHTLPRNFYDNWVRVGLEEAKHFTMLSRRLKEMGASYGALPAHDGLWQAADETKDDLMARLAIVPLVLEARGLDVTPPTIAKLNKAGDHESAAILEIIYRDEKNHVAFGSRWFRYMCQREGKAPEPAFHALVRKHFKGSLKPPFNDRARSAAGLTPGFYKPLMSIA
jgi:uncharacterized ferritin-like protein (DUF455 family)